MEKFFKNDMTVKAQDYGLPSFFFFFNYYYSEEVLAGGTCYDLSHLDSFASLVWHALLAACLIVRLCWLQVSWNLAYL